MNTTPITGEAADFDVGAPAETNTVAAAPTQPTIESAPAPKRQGLLARAWSMFTETARSQPATPIAARPVEPETVTLPALPKLDLEAATRSAPLYPQLRDAVTELRGIYKRMQAIRPAAIADRVETLRQQAKVGSVDPEAVAADIVGLRERALEENRLLTTRISEVFHQKAKPALVEVVEHAVREVEASLATAREIDSSTAERYGATMNIAARYERVLDNLNYELKRLADPVTYSRHLVPGNEMSYHFMLELVPEAPEGSA